MSTSTLMRRSRSLMVLLAIVATLAFATLTRSFLPDHAFHVDSSLPAVAEGPQSDPGGGG